MATYFPMPKLGLDMTSGVLVRWLVKEGETVREGQPILEIETDKAAQELNAPTGGILARILKAEGAEVPCGEAMAVILAEGEAMPRVEAAVPAAPAPASSAASSRPQAVQQGGQAGRLFISPVARRRAGELGLAVDSIVPRNGKIGLEEVEETHRRQQASGNASLSGPDDGRQAMSATRRKIAEHMSLSARTVARVGLTLEMDAGNLQAWRAKYARDGKKVSYNVLLAKLVGQVLGEFPYMNARLEGQAILTLAEVNIGIAVDTPKGLLAPVLRQVDRKDVLVLEEEYEQLIARALAGESRREDLQGGTFTITNLGDLGIETFLPVINVPECAILGVGAILEKPVALAGKVTVRPRLGLTLAFDHRLVDGVPAARFLQRLQQLVEFAGKK